MSIDIDIHKTLRSGNRHFQLDVRFRTDSRRVVLFGPSGAGKSLSLKAIAGLLRPDGGHIRLDGETLFDKGVGINLAPQKRRCGYLFQDYALFPHLTVRQNIGFGLSRRWFAPRGDSQEVGYWLKAFQLEQVAHQLPAELSGGQRQRTALARALVPRPRALLLDEPFAALDAALRTTMRRELDELLRRIDVPMILITHDPADAALFGEHVVRLHEGKVEDNP